MTRRILFFALITLSTAANLASASKHIPESFFRNDLINPNEELPVSLTENGILKKTVPEFIENEGYPAEIHYVTTADGYILELHRIPYGRKCGRAEGKRVIVVQHGLLCDSSNWVVSGANKSLGFMLADECYDVWLGNYRGNTYSRRHAVFDPDKNKEAFWSFSFQEMGVYDLPATFDYVLNYTKTDGIYYVGHSMGTTGFWICMSERPEYNSKIKLMSAYAPVAYTEHMISPIRLITPFAGDLKWLLKMIGIHEFAPSSFFFDFLGKLFCDEKNPLQPVCSNILFLMCGFNWDQVDEEVLPIMLEHMPAGASVSSMVHFAQGVSSKKFQKFDYGSREKNIEKYGQPTPPEYDLSKVTAPVALYWGENDWLGAAIDTHRIAEALPNIQKKYRVNHDNWNHLDFLIARDANTLLHQPMIDFMRNF